MLLILQLLSRILELYNSDTLDKLANVLTATVSILNLYLVYYIFCNDRKERNDNKRREYKFSWYNAFNTEKYLESVDNAIDRIYPKVLSITGDADTATKNNNIKECFENFNNGILSQKRKMTVAMGCISKRNIMKIQKSFSETQDSFSALLNDCSAGRCSSIEARDRLVEIEQDCVSIAYEMGSKLLT